jgi:type IV pilus assembly protein PilY1
MRSSFRSSRHDRRARSLPRAAAAASAFALVASAATAAHAQADVNPPLPNVLLLIDTSGSMENMIDGTSPDASVTNACAPGTTTPMNRWATLVSVLTGSIDEFSCQAAPRSAAFSTEYGFNSQPPYDLNYYLPFHRILSHGCAIGPGTAPTNWWDWPATAFKQHDYTNVATACTTAFSQQTDGLLDTFKDRARFGVMTFDTLPDNSTGISGTLVDPIGGEKGMWSYFPGWQGSSGSSAHGALLGCAPRDYEVGARNGAAPPWEGRLVPFGPTDATLVDLEAQNDRVQQVILGMRPYGATPLAGMLADAQYFLLHDDATDPGSIDPTTHLPRPFGPATDPYFTGGCRKTYIIILSDGEPNMDMRTSCSLGPSTDGRPDGCPYDLPENIARDLYANPTVNQQVTTYVVGFGLATAGGYDCTQLTPTQLADSTCSTATGALKACCSLANIAYNGSGGAQGAFFANDITGLRNALAAVLGDITKDSTSRTYPVFATSGSVAGSTGPGTAGYQFLSSFITPPAAPWTGVLERERYVCETSAGVLSAQLQDVDPSKGDDFAANVNTPDGTHPRQFFTYLVDPTTSGAVNSTYSIRPGFTGTDDGLGLTTGAVTALGPAVSGSFIPALTADPKALGVDPTTPPTTCLSTLKATNATDCVNRLMRWNVGLTNTPDLPDSRDPNNCPAGSTCSMLGSIYHATPALLGPPHDFLQDESYSEFALAQQKRPSVLFAATTDGQLHAFKVASNDPADSFQVDTLANNEMWSFFPPVVLPRLLSAYNQQSLLLDGGVVVKDVIFERTKAQALQGGSASNLWHTVLVGSGGSAGGYYYALDVTNPAAPTFLWQLSTDSAGNPLFGSSVPQPSLATITLQDGTDVKEVAVAILAGGSAPVQTGSPPPSCPRQQTSWPNLTLTSSNSANFVIRSSVRCWGPPAATNTGASRSVTIVRLDTGEVLMNLRGVLADGPPGFNPVVNQELVYIDSPMSGVPVAYPSQVGEVADRAYIGDADGTLWRIDLSSADPTKWTVDMAWDAYSEASDTSQTGEPIETTPIVSIDALGNPVVLFSTGDQQLFTTTTPVTRVWSLTEKPVAPTGYNIAANWVIGFTGGERVTGPISLFNGVAYFATFTPQVSVQNACTDGYGSIWGVDYSKEDPAHAPSSEKPYPLAEYVADPINAPTTKIAQCVNPLQVVSPTNASQQAAASCGNPTSPAPDGVVVFGVGVTQTPSCADTTNFTDPFLGSHTAVSQASGGNFQLVFQTGKGGSKQAGADTHTVTQSLPSPRQTTRIDSWASIVE